MEAERPFGGFSRFDGHRQIVVHVNRLDADRVADPGNTPRDRRLEAIAIERDLAPCQGATQCAVHSAGDGGDDMIQCRGDRRPFFGAVVLA